MTASATPLRSVDHLVLPTANLDVARARLEALGFTVAPKGVHPFGTENVCVYLADGSFIEFLAVGDADKVRDAVKAGNVFVTRDQAYRKQFGEEGFSALVLASQDARADHVAFVDADLSAGEMLAFSRPFVDKGGKADTASFLLAFAGIAQALPFFFACERVNAPKVDRGSLERHANGVVSLAGVTIATQDPARVTEGLATICATGAAQLERGSYRLALSGASIDVMDYGLFARYTGMDAPGLPGLALSAATFRVDDLAAFEGLLKTNQIGCQKQGDRFVVSATAGQGAIFMFEEVQ